MPHVLTSPRATGYSVVQTTCATTHPTQPSPRPSAFLAGGDCDAEGDRGALPCAPQLRQEALRLWPFGASRGWVIRGRAGGKHRKES